VVPQGEVGLGQQLVAGPPLLLEPRGLDLGEVAAHVGVRPATPQVESSARGVAGAAEVTLRQQPTRCDQAVTEDDRVDLARVEREAVAGRLRDDDVLGGHLAQPSAQP
jgi:hypothetical protein